MEFRRYRYRVYPSKKQQTNILKIFNIHKKIYNELLALSKDAYKYGNVFLDEFDYNNYLSGKYNEYVYSRSKQQISKRLAFAYKRFFQRMKTPLAKRKGFPRYKSKTISMTYADQGFKLLSNKKIKISKIGTIPIKLHRIPKGILKNMTIKINNANQWHIIFDCQINIPKQIRIDNTSTGIDLGIDNFAAFSDGTMIKNPKFFEVVRKKLRLINKKIARRKKGSNNYKKMCKKRAKIYLKITNQHTDFLHKLSYDITKKFHNIIIENLRVRDFMTAKRFRKKKIIDASWTRFAIFLGYKAITSGSNLVKVESENTSKICSKCKKINPKNTYVKFFKCPHCGFVCHRDLNAAINILTIGMAGLAKTLTPVDDCIRPSLSKASIYETGTIRNNV